MKIIKSILNLLQNMLSIPFYLLIIIGLIGIIILNYSVGVTYVKPIVEYIKKAKET